MIRFPSSTNAPFVKQEKRTLQRSSSLTLAPFSFSVQILLNVVNRYFPEGTLTWDKANILMGRNPIFLKKYNYIHFIPLVYNN